MHFKAMQTIKKVIEGLILKLEIDKSGRIDLDSLVENFDGFSSIIDKYFKSDLLPLGGGLIILSFLDNILKETSYIEEKTSLSQILDKEQINKIADTIACYLASGPRDYEFRLLLPKTIYKDLLSDRIGEASLSIQKGKLALGEALQDKYYLVIRLKGLLSGSISDELYQQAIARFKFVIQIFLLLDVFTIRQNKSGLLPILESNAGEPELEIADLSSSPLSCLELSKPCEELSIVNSIELHEKIQGEGKLKDREAILSAHLSIIERLLTHEDERLKRLITATTWLQESLTARNQTLSFINLCIALEALLGSEQQGDLTRTLRDRCSYFIGETLEEREKISQDIASIYTTRSKLVHGLAYRLSARDETLLDKLKPLVTRVILKEYKVMLKS